MFGFVTMGGGILSQIQIKPEILRGGAPSNYPKLILQPVNVK